MRGSAMLFSDEKHVLMLIAHHNFRDEEFIHPRNALMRAGLHVSTVSSSISPARGMFGMEVHPTTMLAGCSHDDYSGLILVGGSGATVYWDDVRVHHLVGSFISNGKPVGAIGEAVAILVRGGYLTDPQPVVRDILQNMLRSGAEQRKKTREEVRKQLIMIADAKYARLFGESFAELLLHPNSAASNPMSFV
ncbi:DJ-1/PfpI family protein [Candidatus Sumerlaeota bacterium]|nr:DJ-1/PfpI family protein [Candidatus Sumerlaeota bacterium]